MADILTLLFDGGRRAGYFCMEIFDVLYDGVRPYTATTSRFLCLLVWYAKRSAADVVGIASWHIAGYVCLFLLSWTILLTSPMWYQSSRKPEVDTHVETAIEEALVNESELEPTIEADIFESHSTELESARSKVMDTEVAANFVTVSEPGQSSVVDTRSLPGDTVAVEAEQDPIDMDLMAKLNAFIDSEEGTMLNTETAANHTLIMESKPTRIVSSDPKSFYSLNNVNAIATSSGSSSNRPHPEPSEYLGSQRLMRLSDNTTPILLDYASRLPDHHVPRIEPMVDRLPTELLCLVFEFVLDAYNGPSSVYHAFHEHSDWDQFKLNTNRPELESFLHFSLAPILLTHVCRRWRSVSVRCPSLWANMYIDGPLNKMHGIFIQRSKAYPLTITVQFEGCESRQPSDRRWEEVCCLLAEQMHRCRRLSVGTCRHQVWTLMHSLNERSAPLLEMLIFEAKREFGRPRVPPLAERFEGGVTFGMFKGCTTRLQQLKLDNVILPTTMLTIGSLTELDLDWALVTPCSRSRGPDHAGVLSILQQCPALTKLKIQVLFFGGGASQDDVLSNPIYLPELAEISILTNDIAWMIQILLSAEAPRLRKLAITAPSRTLGLGPLHLCLKTGYVCPVQRLTLNGSFFTPRDVQCLLTCMPEIRDLTISEVRSSDDILRLLAVPSLSPFLTSFCMFTCKDMTVTTCVDFIHSRAPSTPTSGANGLHMFSMFSCAGIEKKQAHEIRRRTSESNRTSIYHDGDTVEGRTDF